MGITKHAYARFKQRQNIKNPREMKRRFNLALRKGYRFEKDDRLLENRCEYGGFVYVFNARSKVLITTYSAKKPSPISKRRLIEKEKEKEFQKEWRASVYLL